MNQDNLSDLDWLAFRYLANELGESERVAFEEQLAVDQTAREAVARAVELTQTISAARELDEIVVRAADSPAVSRAASQRAIWSSPLAWMSIGAAACLVLVAAVTFGPGLSSVGNALRGIPRAGHQVSDLELAHAWSDAREELAAQNEAWWDRQIAEMQQDVRNLPLHDGPPADFGEDGVPDPIAGVPTWMQSAVASELEPDGDHETREN